MINLPTFLKSSIKWASKNEAVVKAVLSGVGVIVTGVTAAHAGMRAQKVICEKEELAGRELTTKEKIVETWPKFILPMVTGATSIFCIYSSTHVSLKNLATMSALYSASQKDLKLTKEAIKELEGPKMVDKVMDKVAEKKEEQAAKNDNKFYQWSGKGNQKFFDPQTGTYFFSSVEEIRSCVNSVNSDVLNDGWANLNDFYFYLGLLEVRLGDDVGWTHNHLLTVRFTTKLDEYKEACIVLDYEVYPKYFW